MTEFTQTTKKERKKPILESVGIVYSIFRETSDTKTLRIKMPFLSESEKPFTFNPGQFVMVRPEIDGKVVPRAYSISSAPTRALSDGGYFDLTVRQTETPTVSKWLNDRNLGDEILFRGPYGHFFWNENDPNAKEIFLLGAGSGITPLKSILEYIRDKKYKNKSTLIYSVRYENEIISKKELENLEQNSSNVKIVITLTREDQKSSWDGNRGRIDRTMIEQEIEKRKFNLNHTKFYICGTPIFVTSMSDFLKEIGVSKDHILHEKWD